MFHTKIKFVCILKERRGETKPASGGVLSISDSEEGGIEEGIFDIPDILKNL